MNFRYINILVLLFISQVHLVGQDSLRFSGQISLWANYNFGNDIPLQGGARYIPQMNYSVLEGSHGKFDTELSANIFGSAGFRPFDSLSTAGSIKPYRMWARYSSDQFEIRLGLQKLNFGSALMLRPLMWFDGMDPRDPLQLTDGVWGILTRYYFLNNNNLWLWCLYGNNKNRGWEVVPVNKRFPEFGGRIQLQIPSGEAAFTYHHRVADSRSIGGTYNVYEQIPENKFGFDAKWDLKTGFWVEGSFTNKRKDTGIFTNQLVMNTGIDYTFAIGNGLYLAYEQLLATYDERPFSFSNRTLFSLMTVSYPLGIFDKLSTIMYYNWTERNIYSFLNWQRQFDKIVFHVMAYWNPESFQLPAQTASQNIFAGKGIQIMFVFNH
jgi:hypothetical protein